MTLKIKFIAFIVIVHAVIIALLFQIDKFPAWSLLPIELLIMLSIFISVRLYLSLIRPLNLISAGIKTIKDQEFNVRFVNVGQADMDRLINVYNSMIDRLREERTRQQEQHYFLEKLIESSPSGIIVLNFDLLVTNINPAACQILSVSPSDLTGFPLNQIESPLAHQLHQLEAGSWEVIKSGGVQTYRCHKAHFMDRGFAHYFILIEEITREILQSEKKAYEKVIRILSHEINNSIGAIGSILNSCIHYQDQLRPEDRVDYEEALKVAATRSESLQRFVSSVANVVRVPPPMKETCDLHDLLRSVHTLLSAELERREITWEWELQPSPFSIQADVQQMEQVLVNIVKNALEAIDTEGRIIVSTTGDPVKTLKIRNTGPGIPADVKAQLFTPFFSTKKNGKGIGLTLIREILINHAFDFSLDSHADGFTEFTIRFNPPRLISN